MEVGPTFTQHVVIFVALLRWQFLSGGENCRHDAHLDTHGVSTTSQALLRALRALGVMLFFIFFLLGAFFNTLTPRALRRFFWRLPAPLAPAAPAALCPPI